MKYFINTLLLSLCVLALSPVALLAIDTVAYPERRADSPGYKSRTITAIRKGPEEYSAKIIGTPIDLKAGEIVQSVWFVIEFATEDGSAPDQDLALKLGIFRAGITSRDHFVTNPLESPRDSEPNHLEGNFSYATGVGLDPALYTATQRRKISVSPIDSLPGHYLVGVELDTPWQAITNTTVWAWANVEYSDRDRLVKVYQYGETSGNDLQVNQDEMVTELDYTSMIWLELGAPFDYQSSYETLLIGANRAQPTQQKHFKDNKIFKRSPFTLDIQASGGDFSQKNLTLLMSISGHTCELPVAEIETDKIGYALVFGDGPGTPRKRTPIEFRLFDGTTLLGSLKGKLINRKYKGTKRGSLGYRKVQKICDKIAFLQQ